MSRKPAVALLLGFFCLTSRYASAERPEPIGLTDIPSYLAALETRPKIPARRIGFRELWERSENLRDTRVTIEGRLITRFHAASTGRLPARVELWIDTGSNNFVCLVHPERRSPADTSPKIGSRITFTGTFFRLIPYQGGDVERVAPLIIGPGVAESLEKAEGSSHSVGQKPISWDWVVGAAVAGFVLLIMIGRALDRPRSRLSEFELLERIEGAPSFVDDAGEPFSDARIERSERL